MEKLMSTEVDELARFQRSYSRRGLLLRYAKGRVSHFLFRQVLTVMGGMVLIAVDGLVIGLSAMAAALLGEIVDCLVLRRVPDWLKQGRSLKSIQRLTSATAGFQALTIAYCVGLACFGTGDRLAPLFATAFLCGAAINAAVVLPFHPGAAMARLAVYGATPIALFAMSIMAGHPIDSRFGLNAAGSLMLGYMVYLFMSFVAKGFQRQRTNTLALIEKGRELANANAELARRQRDAQHLSLVARNANDSVVLSDHRGRITWVNDAFTRTTGYTIEEARGKTPAKLLNSPATSAETVAEIGSAVAEGRPYRGEILNRTKDGRDIWTEINLVPVLDAEGRTDTIVSIERDVTAARVYAEQMNEARRAAEEGARAKSEFLATMSHEIRTPMNGVIGMADLLGETALSEEQREYTETIRDSAELLLKIIDDVLDLSKLDAGRVELSPVDFDLKLCLSAAIRLLGVQAELKGLDLVLDTAPDLPGKVRADDGRFRQILTNLIGNAIKFTETGSVTLRARTTPRPGGHMLHVEVEDTGIGIPPDKLEHIFEQFSQAEATTTRRFGGTGLGLTISRMLIQAMGGEITVVSEPGKGSCFRFSVPVGRARGTTPIADPRDLAANAELDAGPGGETGAEPDALSAGPAAASSLAGKRILVAEDNKVNRVLIEKFLRDLPVSLDFALDGQQAVDMAEAQPPDLVLMDMSMPVMSGLEATRIIREADRDQPVIVALTANAFDNDREACLAAGMDDFLAKPVRRSDLVACILRHLTQPEPLAAQ